VKGRRPCVVVRPPDLRRHQAPKRFWWPRERNQACVEGQAAAKLGSHPKALMFVRRQSAEAEFVDSEPTFASRRTHRCRWWCSDRRPAVVVKKKPRSCVVRTKAADRSVAIKRPEEARRRSDLPNSASEVQSNRAASSSTRPDVGSHFKALRNLRNAQGLATCVVVRNRPNLRVAVPRPERFRRAEGHRAASFAPTLPDLRRG